MPNYDYQCYDCGSIFEMFQKMSDAPIHTCQVCQGSHVKRLVGGGAGIIFKGSGFYQTDYKNKGMSQNESSSKSSAAPACDTCGAAGTCPANA